MQVIFQDLLKYDFLPATILLEYFLCSLCILVSTQQFLKHLCMFVSYCLFPPFTCDFLIQFVTCLYFIIFCVRMN